ncbi:uncharacterized protein BO97DRAFT_451257 [Aspergillus homomorphus CBS 101889]|uniref:Zn(2)-C6 fungal-type domain-containing protein n=1 Tax=Aspergillus homomorphus (strain CBS 101889) TaxID=1450537 RepID=A0A395I0J2_ASPHC|nr:hypothetical protein BO97DRAFT_451257 [Aspergillus homomorphus CBS 101889]RAL12658.1 hypothetical protein BO97DRAFT_451257 [Aspergillus homomorphus CBS 101889]
MSHNTTIAPTRALRLNPDNHRRKRRPVNCEECRRSKLRCDRQHPCGACKRRKREASCSYDIVAGGIGPLSAQRTTANPRVPAAPNNNTRRIAESPTASLPQPPPPPDCETAQEYLHTRWESVLQRPVPEDDVEPHTLSPLPFGSRMSHEEIIRSLPPKACCDYLVSHFFKHIFALFPILHGPTFQRQYIGFIQQPHEVDLSWLALLFSLCSLALKTIDASDPKLACVWSQLPTSPTPVDVTVSVSRRLLRTAMTCLLQDEFFIRHKFSTFEALLMVLYNLSHNGSVDQGWALLGMALNMGIALRCNENQNLNPIESERRRRCWAGLLTLHTYQGILFRDVDMSYLLNIRSTAPSDVNDTETTDEGITSPPSTRHHGEPTQMSMMMAKVRLFRLSTEICRHISGPSRLDRRLLQEFDAAIAAEQKQWDATYTIDGHPSLLDSTSYAHWCVLQTYAHHLYLLLHRPFHHTKATEFLPTSRDRCITSASALISIHRELYESPLLRNYMWLLNGVTTLKALHAAVALSSCLIDMPPSPAAATANPGGYDLDSFRLEVNAMAVRVASLSSRSNICAKAHRALRHLQAQLGTSEPLTERSEVELQTTFEDWTDIREWMDGDLVNWNLDGAYSIFGSGAI